MPLWIQGQGLDRAVRSRMAQRVDLTHVPYVPKYNLSTARAKHHDGVRATRPLRHASHIVTGPSVLAQYVRLCVPR